METLSDDDRMDHLQGSGGDHHLVSGAGIPRLDTEQPAEVK